MKQQQQTKVKTTVFEIFASFRRTYYGLSLSIYIELERLQSL